MRVKIVENLSRWFEKNSRSLPWRSQPDPYRVWLSEIMLQQTQVATVIPYFERFLQAFPVIEDLARAPLDEVYGLWAGLGYYSRARNLHRGAQAIALRLENGQGLPRNREEWLEVPGVGDYTAGAICSIALEQKEPIVDGNVVRVLARLHAWTDLDAKKSKIWAEASELVNLKITQPRIFNQSLMELGALICRPKNPKCTQCPVEKYCKGKETPELFPAPKPKTVWKYLKEEKWFLMRKSNSGQREIYLVQNGDQGWRRGLWDFPNPESKTLFQAKWVSEFETRYTVTNHKILRKHTVLDLSGPKAREDFGLTSGRWFPVAGLPAIPSPVRKAILQGFSGVV